MRLHSDLYRKVFSAGASREPKCKICNSACFAFDVVDFSKFCNCDPYAHGFSGISVYYFRCGTCDCVFTDFFDDWSREDFSRFVYNDEYIEVDPDYVFKRPNDTAIEWSVRFDVIKGSSVLDFGAGSGGFASAMNAKGYNFESYDPYSSPVMPTGKFDVVTAFEVIEHSPRPVETFDTILNCMGEKKIIIVGQSIQPDDIMEIRGNWWYIAPRNGHCTTYSERSFKRLGDNYGLAYVGGSGLHGFFSNQDDDLSRAIISRIAE